MKKISCLLLSIAMIIILSGCQANGTATQAGANAICGADSPESAIEQYYQGYLMLDAQAMIQVTQFSDECINCYRAQVDNDQLFTYGCASYIQEEILKEFQGNAVEMMIHSLQSERDCLIKVIATGDPSKAVKREDIVIEFVSVENPCLNADWIDIVNASEEYGMSHMDIAYAKFNVKVLSVDMVATEEKGLFKLNNRWYVYDPCNWHYSVDD